MVEFGNNISTAVLSNRVGNKIYLTFSIQSFIIKSSIVFGLCMQTISKWQGQQQTWRRHGKASVTQSTSAIQSHMTVTLDACIGNLKTSDCPKKPIRLHSPLMPRHRPQHSIELRTGGSTMKATQHGSGIMYNPENDYGR